MDNLKLLQTNLNDFLKTLQKEIKLYCCFDKIYYNINSNLNSNKKINTIIRDIIFNFEEDEDKEIDTIISYKSGKKFENILKIINYLESNEIKKDKIKIKKIIKKFNKYFTIKDTKYFKTNYDFNVNKLSDLEVIKNEI